MQCLTTKCRCHYRLCCYCHQGVQDTGPLVVNLTSSHWLGLNSQDSHQACFLMKGTELTFTPPCFSPFSSRHLSFPEASWKPCGSAGCLIPSQGSPGEIPVLICLKICHSSSRYFCTTHLVTYMEHRVMFHLHSACWFPALYSPLLMW